MRRAFVSHSTSDDSYVAEMESFLRAAGFAEVWNDVRSIQPDEEFWPEIERGIQDADTLVVVITAASNASDWVRREVEHARAVSKNIIPVRVEDCPVPPVFEGHDVIELWRRTGDERQFEISRILKYAPAELIGREEQTNLLSQAWKRVLRMEAGRPHVFTVVALGGEGKTSLVAKWAAGMADDDWVGCDAAFAWSFYSQGTHEQSAASSDLFLLEALNFFGDEADRQFAVGSATASEKGRRLARILSHRRALLILDGLEPLQHGPSPPTPGQLKDRGIAALLIGLATTSRSLCVVTTRYSLADLHAFRQTTVTEVKLLRLSRQAGAHMLQSLGVKGSSVRNILLPECLEQVNEFEKLVENMRGHALTLNLIGTFLRDAHGGDIRRQDRIDLEDTGSIKQGGHVARVMAAYESALAAEGDQGKLALSALRLLGLFERPITSNCFDALLQAPAILGLTEQLVNSTDAQRNVAFRRLEDAALLTVNRNAACALETLDAHPMIREYFASQLREQYFDAWREAHMRLYEYLRANTKEGDRPTLEDLQPLYQAMAHGCQAGLLEQAGMQVYFTRIMRGAETNVGGLGGAGFYSTRMLGAYATDLGILTYFYEKPWDRISSAISAFNQAAVLALTGYYLRAIGRLIEALPMTRDAIRISVKQSDWASAARYAKDLSELQLMLGEVSVAMNTAETAVDYAERSADQPKGVFKGDVDWSMFTRATHADALHQAGHLAEAAIRFGQAEALQAKRQPDFPLMYALPGARYCELLLDTVESALWQETMHGGELRPPEVVNQHRVKLEAVARRVAQILDWEAKEHWLLEVALDRLTMGRVAFYMALLGLGSFDQQDISLQLAVDGLRQAGHQHEIPRGLMTRAWLRFSIGSRTGDDSAQADLDEAWEIAERGPMRLHLADIHLYRARLFFRENQYPWESAKTDLAAAEKLIHTCGYHRRAGELADAKAMLRIG